MSVGSTHLSIQQVSWIVDVGSVRRNGGGDRSSADKLRDFEVKKKAQRAGDIGIRQCFQKRLNQTM